MSMMQNIFLSVMFWKVYSHGNLNLEISKGMLGGFNIQETTNNFSVFEECDSSLTLSNIIEIKHSEEKLIQRTTVCKKG